MKMEIWTPETIEKLISGSITEKEEWQKISNAHNTVLYKMKLMLIQNRKTIRKLGRQVQVGYLRAD